jgi:site-specific recombinase XerD
LGHLETDELKLVLESIPLKNAKARRDLALMVFAYNTGARVHEIATARHSRIIRGPAPYIRILGKRRKERETPLWDGTLRLLDAYTERYRAKPRTPVDEDFLFLSSTGGCLTRFTVSRIISHYFTIAAAQLPSLSKKGLTAHSMRHTTAVHLLQSGADINVIRTWLGHASNESLAVYLGLDLKHKRQALQHIITPEFAQICLQHCPENSQSLPIADFLNKL